MRANKRFHDSVGYNGGNYGLWKKYHKAYRKSHKAGDTGWVAYSGHDTQGNLCVRFVGGKYSDMRFGYIKERLFGMALDDMANEGKL